MGLIKSIDQVLQLVLCMGSSQLVVTAFASVLKRHKSVS